jgi:hypothetical protein
MAPRVARRTLGAAALVAALACGGVVGPASSGATEGAVWAGTCTFNLNVSFSPGLRPTPTAQSGSFSGASTCVVNERVTTGSFNGTFATNPATAGMGCASGVVSGTGVFGVATLGFPNPTVAVTFVNHGGAISAVVTRLSTFAGSGEFAQAPADTASCVQGTRLTSTRWTGAIAFEDPEPPSPS